MSRLSRLREFPRSSPTTPKVDCLFPQESHPNLLTFETIFTPTKGGCPCYKTPSPPSSRKPFCQTIQLQAYAARLLERSERSCYLCSCEFIRIREKEPLVPPSSCSTVPAVLCGLVPVCGSAIVRTAGWSSCSFGQPSPTYGLHPTLAGIKLVIPAACS